MEVLPATAHAIQKLTQNSSRFAFSLGVIFEAVVLHPCSTKPPLSNRPLFQTPLALNKL